jgi:hypothetical protein
VFVNAGFYIFVRNTWIKIIVIVILASTKFQKKCSISESILKRKKIQNPNLLTFELSGLQFEFVFLGI